MNIFFLHKNPHDAARLQCDQHVVKGILEVAQMLSTAIYVLDRERYNYEGAYLKPTHASHPTAVWVRRTTENYDWTYSYFVALRTAYEARFKRTHAYEKLGSYVCLPPKCLVEWAKTAPNTHGQLTLPPLVMPDQYKPNPYATLDDTVYAYRRYYRGEKKKFARYRYTETPEFML